MQDNNTRELTVETMREDYTSRGGKESEFYRIMRNAVARRSLAMRATNTHLTIYKDAPFPPLRVGGSWVCDDGGVHRQETDPRSGVDSTVYACPHPIAPVAVLRNIDSGMERLKVAYCKDGQWRYVTADRDKLADKGMIVRTIANKGVEVTSENARNLVSVLADMVQLNTDAVKTQRSIGRLGWISGGESGDGGKDGKDGGNFAPYCTDVVYDGSDAYEAIYKALAPLGHIDVWRATIGILRRQSTVFRIVMGAAFASPLLECLNALPFVLHVWGGTGAGKTVAGMCAMSIYGNPTKGKLMWSLNSTYAFFGASASFLRNIPMFADELETVSTGYMSPDRLVMYLCEGIDRGRGSADGGTRETRQWSNAFIFTGEHPVSSDASGGGVKNRLIEIKLSDGEVLVPEGNKIVSIIQQNYGLAGQPYIEHIAAQGKSALNERYNALQKEIMQRKDTTAKQALSMAAIILGDQLACESVLQGEQPLTVDDCLPYLQTLDEIDVSKRAYDWALDWIASSTARFTSYNEGNSGEVWGRIDGGIATINRTVLEREMTKAGLPYGAVVSAWVSRGWIIKAKDGKSTHVTSMGSRGTVGRYYKLRTDVGAAQEEQEALPF